MNTIAFHRNPIAIATAVLLLHVGGLVALHSGLLVRAYEIVVPVEMISQIIAPPKPEIAPPPPPAPPVPPTPSPAPPKQITLPPAPQPLAINDPTPAPNAPIVVPSPAAPLPPIAAPVAISPTPPAPPASPAPPAPPAPKVELPRSDADYLNNPAPPYPPISRRLGEQGRTMVRVFVSAEGLPLRAEVRSSSGFERLDATAVATALRYRYRPGSRGGVPEAMSVNVPFDFKLD